MLTGFLAVIGIPFLLVSGHFVDSTRFITMGIVALASISALLGMIIICGRFIGYFEASDFWVSLITLLIVLPIVFLYISGIFVARNREEQAEKYTGSYNLNVLGNTLIQYAKNNNNNRLPLSENWCDVLMEYNEELTLDNFKHPQAEKTGRTGEFHYAFNPELSGSDIRDISGDTILLFEADGSWNLAGKSELIKNHIGIERSCISVFHMSKKIQNYWFYKKSIRVIDREYGMHYEKPKWNP